MDRNFDDFQTALCRTENEIEISERIELPEIVSLCGNFSIGVSRQYLCAAQGVGEPLVNQEAEGRREQPIGDQIKRPHRLSLHRVDKARAVDELSLTRCYCRMELWQRLRRHGQISIQDHKDVAFGFIEAFAHGITLPSSLLL